MSFDENVTSKIKCISISFIWLEVIAFAIHYFFFFTRVRPGVYEILSFKMFTALNVNFMVMTEMVL